MNIQVLEALNIPTAFVLGTSQGGWITTRMALLAPSKIEGIIPLGTSMDYESARSVRLGCWDGAETTTGTIAMFSSLEPTPAFELPDDYCNFLIDVGLGADCDAGSRAAWNKEMKANYQGDEGRRRARMAAINLGSRDGLHLRLGDVRCPVLWLHGTKDVVYSVSNAQEEIKMFTGSKSAELLVVEGGTHFLNESSPKEVDLALAQFVERWGTTRFRL